MPLPGVLPKGVKIRHLLSNKKRLYPPKKRKMIIDFALAFPIVYV